MDFNESAIVRFVPDLDEGNPLGFITENLTHSLWINGKKKVIPCLSMYGESCPCCELSRKYYDEGNADLGKKYWRKKDYIGSCIVVNSPFEDDYNDHRVRLISIGPKIYKIIQDAFMSGDLDEIPSSYENGYDFRLSKSKQGEFADYALSRFSPRQTALAQDLVDTIENERINLGEARARYISREQMEALIAADLTGESVDDHNDDGGIQNMNTSQNVSKPSIDVQKSATSVVPEPSVADQPVSGEDLLAKIRSRIGNK